MTCPDTNDFKKLSGTTLVNRIRSVEIKKTNIKSEWDKNLCWKGQISEEFRTQIRLLERTFSAFFVGCQWRNMEAGSDFLTHFPSPRQTLHLPCRSHHWL